MPWPPIRIWRALAPDHIEDSCVQRLAWAQDGTLYALLGVNRKHIATIQDGKLKALIPRKRAEDSVSALFADRPATMIPEGLDLPYYPGRQYKAVDYIAVPFGDGRVIVGTSDGLLAIVHRDGVFSLGAVAENGPIRSMTINPSKTKMFGVAGDDEDLGSIFSYDDVRGLRRLGIVNTELPQFNDTASLNLLSACALSPDGKYLALGSGDRLGTVVLYELWRLAWGKCGSFNGDEVRGGFGYGKSVKGRRLWRSSRRRDDSRSVAPSGRRIGGCMR